MASSVSPPVKDSSKRIPAGVAPLRAGQGNSFLWRRLHSLSGIVPVGAFLVEHFISNAFATNGPVAYGDQVKFLTGLPFTIWLEIFGIYIPLLFHALYGVYIWWRGESNVQSYPWTGNWMYTAQRYTGIIAMIFIVWHTIDMRFTGVHLFGGGFIYAFGKVRAEFGETHNLFVYPIGIIAASWHFAYGIWLFCAKWGITVGENARRKLGYVCLAIGLGFTGLGLITMKAFVYPHKDWPATVQEPIDGQNGKAGVDLPADKQEKE